MSNIDFIKIGIFCLAIIYSIFIFQTKDINKVKLIFTGLIFFDLGVTIFPVFSPIDRLWFSALLLSALFRYKELKNHLKKIPYLIYIIIFSVIFILLGFFDQRYSLWRNLIRSISYTIDSFGLFLLIGFFIKTKNDVIKILKFFYYIILICAFYSFFVFIFKNNPYNKFFSDLYNINDISNEFLNRGRIAVSSFIINPHRNGIFMALAVIIRFFLYDKAIANWKFNKQQYFFLLIIILSNILSNSRAAYIAFIVGISIYSIYAFSNKYKTYVLLSLIPYFIITTIFVKIDFSKFDVPALLIKKGIIKETGNDNKLEITEDVYGSSYEMRKEQFLLSIDLIKDDWLSGKGFRWLKEEFGLDATKKDFVMKKGYNGFESFILIVLVDTGVLGLIAYGIVFFGIIKYNFLNIIKINKNKNVLLSANAIISILFIYLFFIVITGEGHITPLVFSIIAILTKNIQIGEEYGEI